MKTTREMKRKGFTLVELLIVIVVIGVLSAMMMLSSTEAVSSARAASIISNLRNLKTAALSYYADNIDTAEALKTGTTGTDTLEGKREDIMKYLGESEKSTQMQNYKFEINSDNEWYVYLTGGDLSNTNVQTKLANRAASTGVLKSAAMKKNDGSANTYESGTNGTKAYMFIR